MLDGKKKKEKQLRKETNGIARNFLFPATAPSTLREYSMELLLSVVAIPFLIIG